MKFKSLIERLEENKMVNKATLSMLAVLLMVALIGVYAPKASAQTAAPNQAVITVSGVPASTNSLAVEITVDTMIVKIASASSDVSGALVVTGSNSEGVGIVATSGSLPTSIMITLPLTGVAAGTSMVSVGKVLDKLGGTQITGATAAVDISSVTVSGSSTSSSSSSSSSGGTSMGGQLSKDTFTITINGQALTATNAVNVTLAFGTPNVVSLDTGLTFTGTGATQLLTDVNATTNVLSAVWNGSVTDNKITLTGMLKPGTVAGTTTIAVSMVEAAGGQDITGSIASSVDPVSVTNSAASSSGATTTSSSGGTFTLIGPTMLVGPGKAAIAFSASPKPTSATLNGAKVDFISDTVGVAIVDLSMSSSGSLSLSLVTTTGMTAGSPINLGTVEVSTGEEGKLPKVTSASASNKSSGTKLTVTGKAFVVDGTSVVIVPTDKTPSADPVVKKSSIKASYDASDCIPKGSYVNVSTATGTASKKIKTRGSCSVD
jgi:hypothetical protein